MLACLKCVTMLCICLFICLRVDLEHGHEKKTEFNYLKAFLIGNKTSNIRARVGEKCASVEEQVDCLIDHATDPNILGRTYHGWEPWV